MIYMINMHFIYFIFIIILLLDEEKKVIKMLISLVGLSASGKSYISNLLKSYNKRIVHLDIDKIGHQALLDSEIKEKLVHYFGQSILENNYIVRSKLSSIVFNSKDAMSILTDLTWSYMEKVIDNFILSHPNNIILLDWLLLPKTKYFAESDLRILITAPLEVRMKRAIARDGITEEQFMSRETNAPEINQDNFEYIINNIDYEYTKKKVDELYDKSIIHR